GSKQPRLSGYARGGVLPARQQGEGDRDPEAGDYPGADGAVLSTAAQTDQSRRPGRGPAFQRRIDERTTETPRPREDQDQEAKEFIGVYGRPIRTTQFLSSWS